MNSLELQLTLLAQSQWGERRLNRRGEPTMLRELRQLRDDRTPYPRKADKDPDDSVFVVLLAETVADVRSWNVGSIWLTLGEAEGAINRYVTEGHKAHHGWNYAIIMEYQTGDLAPKAERHGDERKFAPAGAIYSTDNERIAALELEIAKLKAAQGQQSTVGRFDRVVPA